MDAYEAVPHKVMITFGGAVFSPVSYIISEYIALFHSLIAVFLRVFGCFWG